MFPLPSADIEGAEADAEGLQSWLQRAAEEAKKLPSDFEDVPGREDLAARGTAAFRKLTSGQDALIGPLVGAVQSRTVVVEDPIAFGGHWCPELLEAQLVQRRHTEHTDCVTVSPSQLETLRSTGLLVMPNAIPAAAVKRLRQELCGMDLSRGNHGQHPSVRTDKVAFVEFSESDDMEGAFAILEDVGAQIGSWRGAPLMRPTQGMVAHYAADTGAHYSKHYDNERDHQGFWRNHRVLTALLYLSDDEYSCVLHGGELVAEDTNATTHSINPMAGTLVLFDSRSIEHEVMPMRRAQDLVNSEVACSVRSTSSSSSSASSALEPSGAIDADAEGAGERPAQGEESLPAAVRTAQRFAVSLWFVATTLLETDPLPPSGIKTRPPPPPPKPEVRAVPRYRPRRRTRQQQANGPDGGDASNGRNSNSNDNSDNQNGNENSRDDQDDVEYDEEDDRPVKMARVVVDSSILRENADQVSNCNEGSASSEFSFNFLGS
ncbi:HIF prolyl hydroxylase [Hondaea fermentalgiana]|uniref:HIF prolyl hydroxylase n=1 Tax=Hondaea fermentalgiana TaxID=2315210 RepID=A0A2R5GCK6_9STRA|nr:HIF prolyl hydroxylase [Hondaea fermentalgiana]|eukprot:GBG28702.1 HIF prolyl hydroxylase [Hondaea fermentalgiana]